MLILMGEPAALERLVDEAELKLARDEHEPADRHARRRRSASWRRSSPRIRRWSIAPPRQYRLYDHHHVQPARGEPERHAASRTECVRHGSSRRRGRAARQSCRRCRRRSANCAVCRSRSATCGSGAVGAACCRYRCWSLAMALVALERHSGRDRVLRRGGRDPADQSADAARGLRGRRVADPGDARRADSGERSPAHHRRHRSDRRLAVGRRAGLAAARRARADHGRGDGGDAVPQQCRDRAGDGADRRELRQDARLQSRPVPDGGRDRRRLRLPHADRTPVQYAGDGRRAATASAITGGSACRCRSSS